VITPSYLMACVRELLTGTDALVLTEAITGCQVAAEQPEDQSAGIAAGVWRQFGGLGRWRRRRG
jgi:hypothetical protein